MLSVDTMTYLNIPERAMSFKSLSKTMAFVTFLMISIVITSACSSSVKVRSDVAPGVDLSSYQTYGFFSQLGVEGEHYSSLLGQHFRDAVSRQMESRGFTSSDSPQLQVNVSVGAQDKVKVNTYDDPYLYGGHYGYRGYGFYGSPWYGSGTRTTVHQYTEANVYVDVVDASKHELVWQGVATFTLTDKMQENVRETVNATVDKIFTQFPVAAPATP
jgi:hypothetical protein